MLGDLVATAAAALVAVTFLGLTAVVQVHGLRLGRWLKARDAFALIPAWTFFAPNPGTTDTRVLWRQLYRDGTTSPWRETSAPKPGLLRALWNPEKRIRKAITDVGPMVARRAAEHPADRRLLISVPFLMLLNHVVGQASTPLVEAVQFVVVQTTGPDGGPIPPRILVVSNWHRLAEEARSPRDVGRSEASPREASTPGEAAPASSGPPTGAGPP